MSNKEPPGAYTDLCKEGEESGPSKGLVAAEHNGGLLKVDGYEDKKPSAVATPPNQEAPANAARKSELKGQSSEEQSNNNGPKNHSGIPKDDGFPFDPSLLAITEEELHWALNVKDAVKRLPDLDTLSDLMYCHLGIASKGDVEWAIGRAYKMQLVRQQYKILGTYEEGAKAIRTFMEKAPGTIMSFSYNPHNGRAVLVIDSCATPLNKVFEDPKSTEITVRGCFYLCYALFPSLECVRVGNIHAFETEGYDYGRGFLHARLYAKLTQNTHSAFPSVLKEVRFYNTSAIGNMILGMATRLIPEENAKKQKLGCKFSGGRLDSFYMLPTPEEAFHRTYMNICSGLKMRLESEKAFKLNFKPPTKHSQAAPSTSAN
ncbi:expressed unknown protein [Seminavis robusta]|uniref:Uncharacterized protein n=1 Tax=Seminavis robusta TaxID=568900 RepID=A0A9N8DGG1_9STRA|nr:expressed unknown protein [Seminavis robusta]|eukprot:Sro139_g065230.1 n/a (374) ;mRNA; f:96591-97712